MSVRRLREYVRGIERAGEQLERSRRQRGEEGGITAEFPPVILVLPGMLVSGRVVSGRGYNQLERASLEQARRAADETGTEGSVADALVRLFREPTPEEVGSILQEDHEPETIYLVDVSVLVGAGVSELPQLEVDFDRVLGWALGELLA